MTTPKPPASPNQDGPPSDAPSRRGGIGPSERPVIQSRSIPTLDISEELGDFEFDPDDVLASLVPYDEVTKFEDLEVLPPDLGPEKPAQDYLEEVGLADAFRTIASRVSKELASTADLAEAAELALSVSELHAVCGSTDEALSFAKRAVDRQPNSKLARTQVRHLSFEAGDYQAIPPLIADELAVVKDTDCKAQLALWQYEFLRLALNDNDSAQATLSELGNDISANAHVGLLRFLADFARSNEGSIDARQLPELPMLSQSTLDAILRIRGIEAGRATTFRHPAPAILEASGALIQGDLEHAYNWLSTLSQSLPSCAPALGWLCACVTAHAAELRKKSIEQLLSIERIDASLEVKRALVERSIEDRNTELLTRLVDSANLGSRSSNDAAEQLVLSLFRASPSSRTRELFEDASNDNSLVPLAVAALDLLDRSSNDFSGTDRHVRSLLMTARRIATASPSHRVTLPVWNTPTDNSDEFVSLDFVLHLEHAYENGDWGVLGQLILDAEDGSGAWQAGDRETLASLYFEAARDEKNAKETWSKLLTAHPNRESAVRATLEGISDAEKARLLETYADSLELSEARVPWLLLEAALRSESTKTQTALQYLEHAHAISPELVLTSSMGEDLSRLSGNSDQAIGWLGKRADIAEDAAEMALLGAAEALVSYSDDAIAAETCATRALAALPSDATLQGLRDYVAPGTNPVEFNLPANEQLPNEVLLEAAGRSAWAGDWRSANDAVIPLAEGDASDVAKIWAELAANAGQRNSKLFDSLFSSARAETDPDVQREFYERLLRLDPNFGKEGATDLWLNAIIERTPDNLLALRGLERSNARRSRWAELITTSEKLMQHLDHHEANGYAWLASTLNIYTATWSNGEAATEWAFRQRPMPLWALRRQYSYANFKADLPTVYSIQSQLAERAHYAADVTSLKIRNAEVAKSQGDVDRAMADIRAALDITPDHAVALSLQVTWHLERGDTSAAAEVLEQIAQSCSVQTHREDALSRAAEIWQEIGDEARTEYALEQLLNTNPSNSIAASKLTAIYRTSGSHDRLAALLERQIESATDSAERTKLQVERARCLLALNLTIAAEKALEPALASFPDDIDVLQMKADIALAVDDRSEAEATYTRLLKLVDEPQKQAEIYRRLGGLYEVNPNQADVAESTYRRLLEILPNDGAALGALVRLSLARNDVPEAIRLQNQLVENPELPEQQRQHQIELARIYDLRANDKRRAEEILEKARRKWPNDSLVLRAFAEFHKRNNDAAAVQVLLDRSVTEARRALHTGRFDVAFFEILATVAELRGQAESANVADSVAQALRGGAAPLRGVGLAAANPRHDESLAPELINLPLRAMLQRTGWALDAAQPAELSGLKVTTLGDTNAALFDHIAVLAEQFELAGLTVWLSSKLGAACIPTQCRPPTLVIGQKLLDPAYDSVRDFLIVRALKALQTNTACLARLPALEIWPLLAAYLGVFLPDWQPPSLDPKRFEEAKQRILTTLASAFTHDMAALAQEVVVALCNRASQVGDAVKEWGSRTALLALDNPSDALDALAITANAPPLQKDNPSERVKWINRHAEARNLMIFAVSEDFLQLRAQLLHG